MIWEKDQLFFLKMIVINMNNNFNFLKWKDGKSLEMFLHMKQV